MNPRDALTIYCTALPLISLLFGIPSRWDNDAQIWARLRLIGTAIFCFVCVWLCRSGV